MQTNRRAVALFIPCEAGAPARLVALDDSTPAAFQQEVRLLLGGPAAASLFRDRSARAYSAKGFEGPINKDATTYLDRGRRLRTPSAQRGPVLIVGTSDQEIRFSGEELPASLPDERHSDLPGHIIRHYRAIAGEVLDPEGLLPNLAPPTPGRDLDF